MTVFRSSAIAAALMATAALPALAEQSPTTNAVPQMQGAAPQQGELSDALVHKVGAALRQTAVIRQKYAERAQSMNPAQQQQLTGQAQSEMMQAIGDQGLSVQQYNQVLQLAQADPTLRQRLMSAAQSGG
jgi:hypothetical protein